MELTKSDISNRVSRRKAITWIFNEIGLKWLIEYSVNTATNQRNMNAFSFLVGDKLLDFSFGHKDNNSYIMK
jgi:hypothetical protein